jgi:F-box/leucine-rich repeat protein 14
VPNFLSPADDHHLDTLLAACAEEPWDIDLRLILADWLEDHGDPRAELYRLAAKDADIKPWLRRWGDDWLGHDAELWLKNKAGRLVIEWDPSSSGKGAFLLEEGWVNGLIARGIFSLSMVGEGKRLSDVAFSLSSDISNDTISRLHDLPSLRAIDCSDWETLSNRGVESISSLSSLKSVNLSGCRKLTNVALESVRKLPNLERLNLSGCKRMTVGALRHLPQIKKLSHLGIASLDWLTDAALPTLRELTTLEHLDVSYCFYVTDALMDTLASLPKLKSLALAGATVTVDWTEARVPGAAPPFLDDAFFRFFLRILPRRAVDIGNVLADMVVGMNGVTREGLRKIANLKTLESLDISFSQQIDGNLLRELGTLPRLRHLNLALCQRITGDSLFILAGVPALQSLTLISNDQVNDAAIASLSHMRNLRRLVLDCPNVSNEAVARLRDQMPHCDIQYRMKQNPFGDIAKR